MAITQTTAGLVVFDDMERPSSASMGSPTFPPASPAWTEIETAAGNMGIRTHVAPVVQVAQNQNAASSSNEAYLTPSVAPAGIDTICQVNIDHDNAGFGGIRIPIGDPAPNGGIFGLTVSFVVPGGVPALELWNYFGVVQCTAPITFPNNRVIRLVVRDQGGGFVITAAYQNVLATPPSPFLVGLTSPLTLICTSGVFALAPAVMGPGGFHGVVHQRDGDSKMFFRCGRNVVMTGLPVGWGIRIDGGSVATEVAGVATLDVDGVPLPYTEVQVVDGAVVQQDQFTPITGIVEGAPAGGWGGDEFNLIAVIPPAAPTDLTCDCIDEELAIQLNWVDNSGNEDGFRIERSLDDTFTTIVSFIVGVDVVEFVDDTVEESTRYFYRVFAFNTDGDSAPTNVVNCVGRMWTECDPPPVTVFDKFRNPTVCIAGELEFTGEDGEAFFDDFNRSDRALDGDNGWTEDLSLGEWDIVSNEANSGDTDDNILFQQNSEVLGNHLVEAVFKSAVINGQGLVTRFVSLDPTDQSFYLAQINDVLGEIKLFRRLDGVFSTLATLVEAIPAPPVRLRMTIEDASSTETIIRVVINEVLKITHCDLTPLQGSQYDGVGFRQNNPSIVDDFRLTKDRIVLLRTVPTLWEADIDANGFVLESNEEIKIPMETVAHPAATVTLRESGGLIADTDTPVGGFFAGAIFDVEQRVG